MGKITRTIALASTLQHCAKLSHTLSSELNDETLQLGEVVQLPTHKSNNSTKISSEHLLHLFYAQLADVKTYHAKHEISNKALLMSNQELQIVKTKRKPTTIALLTNNSSSNEGRNENTEIQKPTATN